jgi:hypothetical protein
MECISCICGLRKEWRGDEWLEDEKRSPESGACVSVVMNVNIGRSVEKKQREKERKEFGLGVV